MITLHCVRDRGATASCLLMSLLFVCLVTPYKAQAQTPDPLADPIVHGAWLYVGNCVRCHGDYAKARLGDGVDAIQLRKRISGDPGQGCRISWSIVKGGSLKSNEINAIIAFITAWEKAGVAPELPMPPPQPTRAPAPMPTTASGPVTPAAPAAEAAAIAPELSAALAVDQVATGAWLYVRNCYRCHREYATARMGSALPLEQVKSTVREGKAGTNMPAFGIARGGALKSAQIGSVVAYIEAWETTGSEPALPDLIQAAIRAETALVPMPTVQSSVFLAAEPGIDWEALQPWSPMLWLPVLSSGCLLFVLVAIALWRY